MICPTHNALMIPRQTSFGTRYACCVEGCDIAAWNGSTSTPADAETRTLRRQCHSLFDPLWKEGHWRRTRAYAWLALFMGLSKEEAHIGRFNADQCRKLIDVLEAARGEIPLEVKPDSP